MYWQPAAARGEASKSLMLLLCDSGRCNRFAAAEPELREGGCEALPQSSAGDRTLRRPQGAGLQTRGQNHTNRRAAPELALGFYATAVQLGDMFHNCEPETGTAKLAASRFVSTIEALENPWQIIFADPNSMIVHAEDDLRALVDRLQTNLSALTRIFQGVIQHIIEDFMQPRFICADRPRMRRKIDNYFQLLLRKLFPPIAENALE